MSRVMHFEIPADDPQRLISFFEKTFGWSFQKWDSPVDYWLISTGPQDAPGIDGGLGRREAGNPMVVNTIDVSDLDATAQQVEANGGSIVLPKMAVPGVGWMAYFKDTEGNIHGMMQSDPSAS